MADLWDSIQTILNRVDAGSVVDILLIALMFYWVLLLLRGTTAMTLLRGAAFLLIAAVALARIFDLRVLNFIIRNSFVGILIAVPIIFQPEIRRALERLGRTGLRAWLRRPGYEEAIEAVSSAVVSLAQQRHGALIILERETGLEDYIITGVRVDAAPSPELLEGIFYPNSPLHDGAVILREDRVVAASCTLPLSDDTWGAHLGTRHRAAIGITEGTDAVSVVVSEQTGQISVASNGRMIPRLDEARLRATLAALMGQPSLVRASKGA